MRSPLLFAFLLFCFVGNTQEKIETDRPDQTETAVVIDKNIFQAEIGFNKENAKDENYTIVHPTALLKYGIRKGIELRLETNYTTEYIKFIPQTKEITVFEPLVLGTKIALFEEKGILPKTTLIADISLPFSGSANARTTNAAPGFRFSMQHSLSKNIGLGYNVGAEWDGETSVPEWIYTFAPGFNIGERWYAYIEAFGFITKGEAPDHNFDGGLAYFVSDNFKVDLSGGVGLSETSLKNYVALGFSFRINMKKPQPQEK